MAKKSLDLLTETMYYILMSLLKEVRCGTEIAQFAEQHSGGRVTIGPGTLYTILGKFEKEKLIQEIHSEGRKRTYQLTALGFHVYQEELSRLKICVRDGQDALS